MSDKNIQTMTIEEVVGLGRDIILQHDPELESNERLLNEKTFETIYKAIYVKGLINRWEMAKVGLRLGYYAPLDFLLSRDVDTKYKGSLNDSWDEIIDAKELMPRIDTLLILSFEENEYRLIGELYGIRRLTKSNSFAKKRDVELSNVLTRLLKKFASSESYKLIMHYIKKIDKTDMAKNLDSAHKKLLKDLSELSTQ